MSQNMKDEIEHIDWTDYYSDIKKGESGSQNEDFKSEKEIKKEGEKSKEKFSSRRRCEECEKCDLDPESCNHDKADKH